MFYVSCWEETGAIEVNSDLEWGVPEVMRTAQLDKVVSAYNPRILETGREEPETEFLTARHL